MKMIREISDCESFQNFQENVYDGDYFGKVASLECKCEVTSPSLKLQI